MILITILFSFINLNLLHLSANSQAFSGVMPYNEYKVSFQQETPILALEQVNSPRLSNSSGNKEGNYDLRADGTSELVTLKSGKLIIWEPGSSGIEVKWQTPDEWQVRDFQVSDIDGDNQPDLIFNLWKREADGSWGSHLFIYGWRRDDWRAVWCGSKLVDPVKEFAITGNAPSALPYLVVLEGNYSDPPDAPARYLTLWKWNGFGFVNEWRGQRGKFNDLRTENDSIFVSSEGDLE